MSRILTDEQAQALAAAIIANSSSGKQATIQLALPEPDDEPLPQVKKRGRPARKRTHEEYNGESMELDAYPMDLVDSWVSSKNRWSDDN